MRDAGLACGSGWLFLALHHLRNSSDRVLHFGWPDAGRDGLPGILEPEQQARPASRIRRPRSQNVTPYLNCYSITN